MSTDFPAVGEVSAAPSAGDAPFCAHEEYVRKMLRALSRGASAPAYTLHLRLYSRPSPSPYHLGSQGLGVDVTVLDTSCEPGGWVRYRLTHQSLPCMHEDAAGLAYARDCVQRICFHGGSPAMVSDGALLLRRMLPAMRLVALKNADPAWVPAEDAEMPGISVEWRPECPEPQDIVLSVLSPEKPSPRGENDDTTPPMENA